MTAFSSYPQENKERRALYEEACQTSVLDAVRALGITNLHGRPAGVEFAGPCPVCAGTDRFSINTRKDVFFCRDVRDSSKGHGCGIRGKGGFALACAVHGVDAHEQGEARDRIVELLTRRSLPLFVPLKPFVNGNGSKSLPPGARLSRIFQHPYHDADGTLLFEVYRRDYRLPDGSRFKRVCKRRPDGHGGWHWFYYDRRENVPELERLPDLDEVPYGLPQVLEAVRKGETVYVLEGEKCADAWVDDGRGCATCNRDGVGGEPHWAEIAHWFQGADVVLLPDNDSVGREFMAHVAWYLAPFAANVDQIDIYEDASDREDGRDYADWRRLERRRRAS
jgi:hypothetical protein